MRKLLFVLLLLTGLTSLPAVAKNPEGDSSNIAPITTYVPAVGDTLTFDTEAENLKMRQEATIATIHSDGKVDVEIKIYDANDNSLIASVTASWAPKGDFLKPLENAQCTIAYRNYIVSGRLLPCAVVTIDGAEIWAAYSENTTLFPGLVLLQENGKTVRRLTRIVTKAH